MKFLVSPYKATNYHLRYRPEIDGLRAIAVLAVVIYHAGFTWTGEQVLKGGFIGVDIFFVISGYLISLIIFHEISTGSFTFKNFYERRARRILPVLLVVMLASLPFAWDAMLPQQFVSFHKSILSSLFFGSNFWFWHLDSYWDAPSALMPFLHSWSLSVEEQFYVIFPIFTIFCFRYFRQRIVLIVSIVALLSLLLAEYATREFPDAGFFLLPTRIWELLAGVLLAKLEFRGSAINKTKYLFLLPYLGIVFILGATVLFHKEIKHPSLYTVFPVIGTMLLIRYAQEGDVITRILSNKLFTSIGLISYSLYLWHFPIFAFTRISGKQINNIESLKYVVLSFVLSIASYFLVEQVFRNKNKISSTTFWISLALTLCLLIVLCLKVIQNKGYPERYVNFHKFLKYEAYRYQKPYLYRTCFVAREDFHQPNPFSQCAPINALSSRKTIYFWGDSNAAHLIPGIQHYLASDYHIELRTMGGCGAFFGNVNKGSPGCKELNDKIFEEIITRHPDKVIIAGLWRDGFVDLLEVTIEALKQQGIDDILVIGPVPRWTLGVPRTVFNFGRKHKKLKQLPEYLDDVRFVKIRELDAIFQQMTTQQNVQYYSPLAQFCREGVGCRIHMGDDKLLQWDNQHLTVEGSLYLLEDLRTAIE